MNTGNRLRELRKERGLTLRELADKLCMTYSNIAMIERGERNFTSDSLKSFCDFFDVSSDYLLGLSNQRNSESIQANDVEFALHGTYDKLTSEDKKALITYAEFLINQHNKSSHH